MRTANRAITAQAILRSNGDGSKNRNGERREAQERHLVGEHSREYGERTDGRSWLVDAQH